MSPSISIIIATYNSSKTLSITLDSVIKQSYQDWECIIVDGASKDATVDIIKEYVAIDSRFSFISEPDNGIYDAFNKGWRMARGEWVHYLGSDDRLTDTGFFDLMVESHDDIQILTGDVWIMRQDGSIKADYSVGFKGCHQGKLVRRSVLEMMNGFDEQYKILADADLMIRMEKYGFKVKNIRTFIAYFCMGGVSQSLSSVIQRYHEYIRLHRNRNLAGLPQIYAMRIATRSILSVMYRNFVKFLRFE